MKFKNQEDVYLVAGGPSLQNFNWSLLKDKATIAINNAIFDVPDPDVFVTVDNSFFHKIKCKMKQFAETTAHKVFVVDMSYGYIVEEKGFFYDTRKRERKAYLTNCVDTIIKAYKQYGIGKHMNDFRTGKNSGFCALQLAYLKGFKRIHLLGFDLTVTEDTHYHNVYDGCFKHPFKQTLETYQKYFMRALPKILAQGTEVISHSSISTLNNTIPYEELTK